MTEVVHANIFFIITSIAVVCFSILVCILLYYIIKIVRAIQRIVARIEAGSELLAEDYEEFKETLNPKRLFGFVMNFIPTDAPKKRTRRKTTK